VAGTDAGYASRFEGSIRFWLPFGSAWLGFGSSGIIRALMSTLALTLISVVVILFIVGILKKFTSGWKLFMILWLPIFVGTLWYLIAHDVQDTVNIGVCAVAEYETRTTQQAHVTLHFLFSGRQIRHPPPSLFPDQAQPGDRK
jgi:hypothetical protein